MTALEIGFLQIDDNGCVKVDGNPIDLSPKLKSIFNRIAHSEGVPVAKAEFINAGDVMDENGLKVRISTIRAKLKPYISENAILSTPSKERFKKEQRFDGYALNMKAFEA